jgi:hypothetical protein
MPRLIRTLIPRLVHRLADPKPGTSQEWQLARMLSSEGYLNPSTWYNVLIGRNTPSLLHSLTVKEAVGDLTDMDRALLDDLRAARL